jgi:hypothetical protein
MATGLITKREPTLEEEIALEEQENEEEDEDDGSIPSELICMECMTLVNVGADVVLLKLVVPYALHDNPTIPQFDELMAPHFDARIGTWFEPLLEAIWFDYECFENNAEALAESLEDVPPVEEPGSVLLCDYCGFSIHMGEKCVTATLGEVVFSERVLGTTSFEKAEGEPYAMCLSCANTLFDLAELQGHEGLLTQNGECSDCTTARCWRVGRCMCRCHY